MNLIEACVRHPLSVIMFYTALALFGIISLFKLDLELMPEIKINTVTVVTEYKGMPAEDIEEIITVPIENSLSAVKGVKNIYSITKNEISSVKIELDWNIDIKSVTDDVRSKIDYIFPLLPVKTTRPQIYVTDLNDYPVITLFAAPVPGTGITDISNLVEKDIKSFLLGLKSVSTVSVFGSAEKEIIIDVDYNIMKSLGLEIEQISEVVSSSVFNYPAGTITEGDKEYRLTASTGITEKADLAELKVRGLYSLNFSDLADIYEAEKDKSSFFHYNGDSGIGIFIKKNSNTGAYNCSREIRTKIPYIQDIFKEKISLKIIDDSTDSLRKIITNLFFTLVSGIAAAAVVLKILLKSSCIISITFLSLPSAFFAVFIYMYFSGTTLNTISLTGLTIGSGMVLDNSIIVLENLYVNNIKTAKRTTELTYSILTSISGSTLSTAIVFLPVIFIPGITGNYFSDLVWCIIVFLISSLIISITLVPSLYIITAGRIYSNISEGAQNNTLLNKFNSVFNLFLKYKILKILPGILLAFSFLLLFVLDFEIIPEAENNKSSFKLFFKPGMSKTYYTEAAENTGRQIAGLPGITAVYSRTGYDSSSLFEKGESDTDIFTAVFNVTGNDNFEQIVSGYGRTKIISSNIINKLLDPESEAVFTFTSENRDSALSKAAEFTLQAASLIPSLTCFYDTEKIIPVSMLHPGIDLMTMYNISPLNFIDNLKAGITGINAADIVTNDMRKNIIVRYKRSFISDLSSVMNLSIPSFTAAGSSIPIKNFTDINQTYSFHQLMRKNKKPSVTVEFSGDKKSIKILKKYAANYGNHFLDQYRSELEKVKKETFWIFMCSIFIIYLMLGAQFESFKAPIYIMSIIPLSLSGSFISLLLTGNSINISSIIGMLVMSGTVINSAILVYSGVMRNQNIICSIKRRLLPAAASTGTTIAAVLPLSLLPDSPVQNCSAITLAGGLIAGFIAVFFVFPFYFKTGISK